MTQEFAILVVDDEPDLVKSVRRILRLDGFRVDTATSLKELVERDNWSDYLAILLDRRLPDGSADQILPRLQKLAPDAAVIMVTGYADLDGTMAALHFGAEDFFLKPVDPTHLRARLKRLADQRRAEEELSHERAFAQIMLDTTRALIVVLDREGRILRINRHFEDLCGYRQEELVGQSIIETLVPGHYVETAKRRLEESYAETYEQGTSHPLKCKSNQICEVAWWNAPLKDKHGEIKELVCAGIDMTEHNRIRERLIQSERLAAIGEAMAGLAHESRNALQRSQVCLDLLSEQLEDRPESLELLEAIQRAQDDLHRLYEEVRAYAAPIHIQPRDVDIGDVLRKAWDDVASAQGARRLPGGTRGVRRSAL